MGTRGRKARGYREKFLFYGLDADEAADSAFVYELNDTGDFGEQCVVFTDADVDTGLELRSSLADEDRTAGYQFPSETLHSEPLRIAVAAVS